MLCQKWLITSGGYSFPLIAAESLHRRASRLYGTKTGRHDGDGDAPVAIRPLWQSGRFLRLTAAGTFFTSGLRTDRSRSRKHPPSPRQGLPLDSGGEVWYNIWDFSPAERSESE